MSKRLEELEILRVIGCIAVIIIHVTAGSLVGFLPNSPHLKLAYIINTYTKFAVPLFIFISGVVLMHVYKDKPLIFSSFMKARLISIGVPYLIWNVIYYLIFAARGIYTIDLVFFTKQIFSGTMVYHFYFVIIIFQFYLLSQLWLFCFKSFNPTMLMLLSGFISLGSMKYMVFVYSDRIFMNYLVFFFLGCYLVSLGEEFINSLFKYRGFVYLLALSLGGVFTQQLYEVNIKGASPLWITDYLWHFYSVFAILALYLGSISLTKKYRKEVSFLKPIGDASFYIYLSHPLFLMIAMYMMQRLGINSISVITIFNLLFVTITSSAFGIGYIRRHEILRKIK